MRSKPSDYFCYLPTAPQADLWGLRVTAAGRTSIAPGRAYPPAAHPPDHAFAWAQGRVLESLQIVLITRGRGTLETAGAKAEAVEAGAAFMLLPGVWHRYRPLPQTGWNESWIEVDGPIVKGLIGNGVLAPNRPILRPAAAVELESALAAVHDRIRFSQAGSGPELSALGLAVIAAWNRGRTAPAVRLRQPSAVERGLRYLTEHATEPVNVPTLARQLGIAYSHFRTSFRTATGYSPWQYVLHLRLLRGKQLLSGTDATLDRIAETVGFSSGFHFSAAFKKTFGESPRAWRNRLQLK